MNKEQLNVIEARANAATPGPWIFEADSSDLLFLSREGRYLEAGTIVLWCTRCSTCAAYDEGDKWNCGWPKNNDADFIAHAREDIPALIARIRELETQNGDD